MSFRLLPQKYEVVAASSLELHPDNPHVSDDEAIGQSIDANGFYGALVVQRSSRRVLAGHGRLRQAVALGAGDVPVIFVEVDDAKAVDILLADNKSHENGVYDDAKLAALLESRRTTDELMGTLYAPEEVDELLRRSGVLGEREGAWLDDAAAGATSSAQHDALSGAGEIGGEPEPAAFVVPIDELDRDELIRLLRALQAHRGLTTLTETLLAVTRDAAAAELGYARETAS